MIVRVSQSVMITAVCNNSIRQSRQRAPAWWCGGGRDGLVHPGCHRHPARGVDAGALPLSGRNVDRIECG